VVVTQNKLKALFGNALTSDLMKFSDAVRFLPQVMEQMKIISEESPNFADSEYISHFNFQLLFWFFLTFSSIAQKQR
jgi:hypothetical protein